MSKSPVFYDVYPASLNKQGEELCGDQVKTLRTPDRTIVVLSDGLGNGVKANILARLTTEIIVTMLRAAAPLNDVLETVIGTLPMCKVRKIAYATFIVMDIEQKTGRFKVVNFDSPLPFCLKQGKAVPLNQRTEIILGKQLGVIEGVLGPGDFLAAMSDGVLYAGMGVANNFGWGWKEIGNYLENHWEAHSQTARSLVSKVMQETRHLYANNVGDDATLVGVLARPARRLMVFTGPPVDRERDWECVNRLLDFDGRRAVCGGTTGNIVGHFLGREVEVEISTLREDLPPIGRLPELELCTEGIMTLARALQYLKECNGELTGLPDDRNGALLLTRELLEADSIFFLAGQQVNPFYQNPLLPRSVSIRRSVLDQIVEVLNNYHKEVKVEWC